MIFLHSLFFLVVSVVPLVIPTLGRAVEEVPNRGPQKFLRFLGFSCEAEGLIFHKNMEFLWNFSSCIFMKKPC
jgi:hypothetical protein